MKRSGASGWFRLALAVASAGLLYAVVRSSWSGEAWPYLVLLAQFFFFWMIADACMDLRRIRTFLDSLDFEEKEPSGTSQPWEPRSRSGSKTLEAGLDLGMIRKLGDRTFKADGSKTCSSCKHYRIEERTCALDGASLAGVTVTAVGCQHWVPGLKLTGAEGTAPHAGSPPDSGEAT